MESYGVRLAVLILTLNAILLLLTSPVLCDDEEDHLLSGINSFRQSSNVPPLTKHDKANCIAHEIADQLENTPCASNTSPPTITNHTDVLKKCNVDGNTTRDGMVISVCVPHRVQTLVLTNYTQEPRNSRYLNDSRFTGAGIGTEDDWTVLVLTTTTHGGSFASGTSWGRDLPVMSSLMVMMCFMVLVM